MNPNRARSNNRICRNTHGLTVTLILGVLTYFSSLENAYFLGLSKIQLLTWPAIGLLAVSLSPTGPFSTALPLLLCLSLELSIRTLRWIKTWWQDWTENSRLIRLRDGQAIRNCELYPGHVIKLEAGDISPVDGLVLDAIGGVAKVSCSLLTGESRPKFVYPDPSATGNKHTIYSGTEILSDSVTLQATACGPERAHLTRSHPRSPTSSIDNFMAKFMMRVNLGLLLLGIVTLTITKVVFINTGTGWLFTIVQSWILLNGIVPFSIKIILILSRTIQKYRFSSRTLKIWSSSIIDDLKTVKHVVCDKTGTVTQNRQTVVGFLEAGSNKFSLEPSREFAEYVALSVRVEDGRPETPEDGLLCPYLGAQDQTIEFNLFGSEERVDSGPTHCQIAGVRWTKLDVDGLEFTHDRKRSSQVLESETRLSLSLPSSSIASLPPRSVVDRASGAPSSLNPSLPSSSIAPLALPPRSVFVKAQSPLSEPASKIGLNWTDLRGS